MSRVGSGIINVITESLYDNPIVVFREYVQNSVDSLYKLRDASGSEIRIYYTGNLLIMGMESLRICLMHKWEELRIQASRRVVIWDIKELVDFLGCRIVIA